MIYVEHGAVFFDSQAIMTDLGKHTYQIDQNFFKRRTRANVPLYDLSLNWHRIAKGNLLSIWSITHAIVFFHKT